MLQFRRHSNLRARHESHSWNLLENGACTGLMTFLLFILETAEDAVESKVISARRVHAAAHVTHTNEPPRPHHNAMLAAGG